MEQKMPTTVLSGPPCPVNQNPRSVVSQVITLIDEGSICLESILVLVPAELVETGSMSLALHSGPFWTSESYILQTSSNYWLNLRIQDHFLEQDCSASWIHFTSHHGHVVGRWKGLDILMAWPHRRGRVPWANTISFTYQLLARLFMRIPSQEAGCWSMVEFGSPNNRKDERDRSTSEIVMFEMSSFFQKRRFECPFYLFQVCMCFWCQGGIWGIKVKNLHTTNLEYKMNINEFGI